MAKSVTKPALMLQLQRQLDKNRSAVIDTFKPLPLNVLNWKQNKKEWSVLQCFDHLIMTGKYYAPRIEKALLNPIPSPPANDIYTPSFWGGIYAHYAFNPKYKFPAVSIIQPENSSNLTLDVLDRYLAKLVQIEALFDQIVPLDVSRTLVSIEVGIKFNFGDILRIAVYHDDLHVGQARRVLALQNST